MMYKMDNSYYVLKDMDPKLRKYGEGYRQRIWYERTVLPYRVLPWGDDYIAIEYNNRPAGGFTIDVL